MDIEKLQLTDISKIELDSENDCLTVKFAVMVGPTGEVAEYEEVFEFGKDSPSEGVKRAAFNFAWQVLDEVRYRKSREKEPACVTCAQACCSNEGVIRVTPEDLDRLRSNSEFSEDQVVLYEDGLSWTGHLGQLASRPLPRRMSGLVNSENGCVYVTDKGCGIYEYRPQVCRDYSSYTCGDTYVEDPVKVVARREGRTTLRVLQSENFR